ncbi:hypothetical protein AMATHDRAFT_2506 [Amanita thiersii Skay4041]|uniref:Uncharacterized protein n=1 Tax=Amanita thiersii Skay4041 TaxID=703135 RepID=A0A2A9NUR9_9AGAR|nr:hypothetical protein AMATHDRAFT_2506 [Amanita thiersii Skay4041]
MIPADRDLPQVLDSLLSYLADHLPPPVYSLALDVLSRFIAIVSSFASILTSITTDPTSWDLYGILPSIISILCAYLALLTLYRTTTWMIRTIIWFIKWGFILSVIFTAMGWYLRDAAMGEVGIAGNSLFTSISALYNHASAAMDSTKSHAASSNTHSNTRRPKPWDSFDKHRRWQPENQWTAATADEPADNVLKTVIDIAGGVVKQGVRWWEIAKTVVDDGKSTVENGAAGPEGKRRSRRSRAQ